MRQYILAGALVAYAISAHAESWDDIIARQQQSARVQRELNDLRHRLDQMERDQAFRRLRHSGIWDCERERDGDMTCIEGP